MTTSDFDDNSVFARAPVSERHVQALWYDGTLRPEGLRTVGGARVRVVEPGAWNLEAGPDFRGAVVEVDGVSLKGDVEVHLRAGDWVRHGHVGDPAYARVVVHVTWFGGGAAPVPAGCVTVCLGDHLRTRTDFSPDEIDLAAYPYARLPASPRPCEARFARDPDTLVAVLAAAGRRRLDAKARRLVARFVRTGDRAQVFYEEMMAALGYKHNTVAFRALAERVPWRDLPADPAAAEAALVCAASLEIARQHPWRLANVRPANAPAKRLAAAAALFAGEPGALLRRLDACDLATREGQRAALAVLCGSHRLGVRRAAAMLANVVTPFARAENRLAHVPDWLCPEEVGAPMRLTAYRLLGRDHNPALYAGNGLLLQGLLQIHREFCLAVHPDCRACALAALAEHIPAEANKE